MEVKMYFTQSPTSYMATPDSDTIDVNKDLGPKANARDSICHTSTMHYHTTIAFHLLCGHLVLKFNWQCHVGRMC